MSFDLIVHRRDEKTGRVVETRPYRLVVTREGSYYERAGIKYDAAGNELSPAKVEPVVAKAEPVVTPVKHEQRSTK